MGWRERYRQAFYGGVPFLIDSHEFETGRRGAVHVYPQRDRPTVEDTGRQVRRFRVTGFILGEDYDLTRDLLIAACEARSDGYPQTSGHQLIHPYLGSFEVFCTGLRVRETVSEGRVCTISMDFVETSSTQIPDRQRSTTAAADEVADAINTASAQSVADGLEVLGHPEGVRDASADTLRSLGLQIQRLDVFDGAARDVDVLQDAVSLLIGSAKGLAVAPATAAATVRTALEAMIGSAGSLRGVSSAYVTLFGFSGSSPTGDSATAAAGRRNAELLEEQVLNASAAGAIQAGTRTDWESLDEAVEARTAIVEQLDTLLGCTSGPACEILPDLLAVAANGIPPPDQNLPRLETIELTAWEPALLTAWRLYGDPDRSDELATRNGIPRPGFLPGQTPLEVLTRA